jgi:dienelactone hydrolase
VSYYGGGIGNVEHEQPRCPVLMHFGEKDHAIRLSTSRRSKTRMREPEMVKLNFTVGMNLDGRSRTVNVEAEDALIAALKVKHENSNAVINYVRKCNKRGDQRHPHRRLRSE